MATCRLILNSNPPMAIGQHWVLGRSAWVVYAATEWRLPRIKKKVNKHQNKKQNVKNNI